MARDERADLKAPDPAMVTASRKHLTSTFAAGVDRLLWDLEKRPMPDALAVDAVLDEHHAGRQVDALSIGAALVLVQSIRLELDCLEGEVFDAALASGMSHESVAAVLEMPDADTARRRQEYLDARRKLPRAPAPEQQPVAHDTTDAAARASRRANEAAGRARAAARRREELGNAAQGTRAALTPTGRLPTPARPEGTLARPPSG